MTKEALKKALEAFGEIEWSNNSQWQSDRAKVAITAIKEALANEALEKMAENARELGLDYEPAQEPVAWIDKMVIDVPNQLFYTAPRTWVGLTDEEIKRIGKLDLDSNYFGLWYDFARAIEAKLRSKNSG